MPTGGDYHSLLVICMIFLVVLECVHIYCLRVNMAGCFPDFSACRIKNVE